MTADPVRAERVVSVEEHTGIINRNRSEDLSIHLSMAGGPLRHCRVEGPENLLRADGETLVQCGLNRGDGFIEGLYEPSILLDFGRVITGYIELDAEAPAGAAVDIGYAERLIDGHFNNALESQFADRVTFAGGPQTWQCFQWKAFRFVRLRFHSCKEPLILRGLRAIISTFPYEERGRFQSADPTLNAVFDISRYTIRLCSNEFLMDTPWREQAQWLGDVSAVTLAAIYACFGDPRLPAKFLKQTAATQYPTGLLSNLSNRFTRSPLGVLPDYSLWWILALWRHYLWTGEAWWIQELYPVAAKIIQAHYPYVNERGLIENMPYAPFIDWAFVDRRGESAAYSAIFFAALGVFAEMARFKNDAYELERAERTRAALRAAFHDRFFDPARGVYADGVAEGALSDRISEQTNFAAVRWGLCDEAMARSIIDAFFVKKSLSYVEAQPFFTHVTLHALNRMGRFDLALDLIRERWGKRMVARGAKSTFEEWSDNGSPRSGEFAGVMRTHSHAWSACPAEFLIRHTMGLEILAPGCREIRLRPQETPFDYDAAYPTPLGEISVSRREGRNKITIPEGVRIRP